jgi:cytosine deaminase
MSVASPVDTHHRARHVFGDGLLPDGRRIDVVVEAGFVAEVLPAGSGVAGHRTDLAGRLLLPAFAEPHAHLDKTGTASTIANPTGDLDGAIRAWIAHRSDLAADSFAVRGLAGIRTAALRGATALRTHVDTGAGLDLDALDGLRAVAAGLAGTIDVQLAAGCGLPATGRAGADNRARLAAAVELGIDAIGGAPSLDPEPAQAVEWLASIAAEHRLALDLHIDETLDPNVFVLPRLAAVAAELDVPVTAGHCVSLAVQEPAAQRRVAEQLATAAVVVVALPQTNLYLQGRALGSAAPRGLTAVRTLLDAGVTVAAGSDNVADPFNPMGRADPLEIASLLVTAAHLTPEEALQAVSNAARRALGAAAVHLQAGSPADLVAIRATDVADAIGRADLDRIVIAGGAVVARTTVDERWCGASS